LNKVNEIKDKHIVVTEKTYRQIKSMGNFGESFDDVIQRLLQNHSKEEILKLANEVGDY
jgi:predicted CopG family antitoxin